MPKRKITKRDITEDQFLNFLSKAIKTKSDLAPLETPGIRQDDDCNETDIHSDMIEDIWD